MRGGSIAETAINLIRGSDASSRPLYEAIDAERVALAAALGASVPTPADWRYGQAAPPGRNGFSFSSILRL